MRKLALSALGLTATIGLAVGIALIDRYLRPSLVETEHDLDRLYTGYMRDVRLARGPNYAAILDRTER